MDSRVDFAFVPPAEAARVLGVCESTLQRWRARSEGPAFVRVGSQIRYPWVALAEYVAARTCHTDQHELATTGD